MHLRDDQEDTAEAPYPPDGVYVARDGERVSAIARRFGVNLDKLLGLNASEYAGLQVGLFRPLPLPPPCENHLVRRIRFDST